MNERCIMLTREQMIEACKLDCFAFAFRSYDGYAVQCRAQDIDGLCLAVFYNFDDLCQWAGE